MAALYAVKDRANRLYYLLATVLGAGLLSSTCALTLWICAAYSLSCAVRTCIPLCCRSWNAASISSAAVDEGLLACGVFSSSSHSPVASLTTLGWVAGSSVTKSSGTLEVLMRFVRNAGHFAQYGSPRNSSNERIAGSPLSTR